MRTLTEIAPGVLVATSSYAVTTTTVVVGASGGCLVIDPVVTVAELAGLAGGVPARAVGHSRLRNLLLIPPTLLMLVIARPAGVEAGLKV